ncbi:MAG: 50S ribosome-binding GTPase [Candidatus Lokiarchaeota archaeon]|jgi:small GTP-binding protein|nr:50S ribosome-binding GTPase [Candidatus Lokiarchaeota archaeon]
MTEIPRKSSEFKLVIAGLDNAGKTSALIALRQKYNFYERVKNLKPTIKIDYSSFKFLKTFRINLWDMGGQKKFRKIYINNPIYFEDTDYIYYLIDIQDEIKFEETIEYIQELLDIYRTLSYSNEVIICFNKFDPQFRNSSEFLDRANMIKHLIKSQNKDIKFEFYNTSYYDIASISKAFSHSLNSLLNLGDIDNGLNKLVEKFNCRYAILYTDSGIIISDHYVDMMDIREFDEKIGHKISNDLEFFQRLKDENVTIDDRIAFSEDRTDYVKKFSILSENKDNTFYVGVSTTVSNINIIKIELEKLRNILQISFT